MTRSKLRNLAFLAMTFGGVCLAAVAPRADAGCKTCSNPGSTGECIPPGKGNPGWTGCQDFSNCSVSGSQCTGE